MKQKILAVLREAARAALTAFLAALGLTAASGCCTVISPDGEAPTVSVTGAVPIGFQLNGAKN